MKADEYNGTAAVGGLSARDRLGPDLKALAQDASAVVSDFTEAAGVGLGEAGNRIKHGVKRARARSENLIHRHPWTTIALVGGVCVALGWLLNRR